MQCPRCELENAEGALYCARCHGALPRPLAPGECPFCGRIPEGPEFAPEVCPSCGNDPARGQQVREARVAALLAEVNQHQAEFNQSQQRLRKKGCFPLLCVVGGLLLLMAH